MDDLTLVRELADDTPLPTRDDLATARARVVAGITAPTPVRLLRHRSRFALIGGTTIGLAAAVAAAITLVPRNEVPPSTRPDAVQVLTLAAARALDAPHVAPRPDQFLYTNDHGYESWMSVDGTRDGVIVVEGGSSTRVPGCRDGRKAVVKGDEVVPGRTEECVPEPAYRSDLPTTADAMLDYLDRNASGAPGDVNARGKDVLFLIDGLLAPETRAALFQAASRVPGLEVLPDIRDSTGKPAIGITWPSPGGSSPVSAPPGGPGKANPTILVFDPTTYEYLGSPTRAAGTVSIVDEVGRRP